MNFSIITPSFNQLDWLRLCVASVADQNQQLKQGSWKIEAGSWGADTPASTRSPLAIEHIIQDGGSPGIEEFAKGMGEELMSRYGGGLVTDLQPFELLHLRTASGYTLRIFGEPDAGMYDAINKGIARSSGEICAWLNSDEQYLGRALIAVARFFDMHHSTDVLLGDAILLDSVHRPVCRRRIMVPWRCHTRLAHLHSLSCSMFFRRNALPDPPLEPRWKVIGDAVLMDWFLGSGKKVVASGHAYSCYAFTGQNLSADRSCTEHAVWIEQLDFPPRFCKLPVMALHRVRCLASGAYRRSEVETAVYTLASPEVRINVRATVGGRWPKPESLALSAA